MTTATTLLLLYWAELTFGGEGIKTWWRGGNEQLYIYKRTLPTGFHIQ